MQKPIPEVVLDLARDRFQDLGSDLTAVGNVALSRGLCDEAKEILEKSFLLDDGAAAYNLARLLLYDGNVSEAKGNPKARHGSRRWPLGFWPWLAARGLAGDVDRSGARAAYERDSRLGWRLAGEGDRSGAKAAYQAAVEMGIREAQEKLRHLNGLT